MIGTTTTPRHGLADLFDLAEHADDEALSLAFEWADAKPADRGYPHLIAAFLAVVRVCETVQRGRQA